MFWFGLIIGVFFGYVGCALLSVSDCGGDDEQELSGE